MKKLLLALLVLVFVGSSFAQVDGRKFRFGLKATPGFSWNQSNKVGQSNNGLGTFWGYGFQIEYYFNDVVGLTTGLFLNNTWMGVEYDTDAELKLRYEEPIVGGGAEVKDELIQSRRYNIKSLMIPLRIKLKTPEIGYYTYFLEFGIDNDLNDIISPSQSRKNKIIVDGEVTELDGDVAKLDADNETFFYRAGLNLGVGTEYNLVGTTSLLLALNYSHPITRTLKSESEEIYRNEIGDFQQDIRTHRIMLTVGFLF